VVGGVVTESEIHTRIIVTRVIRGDVRPGTHDVIYGWGVNWSESGTKLATGTWTLFSGDVEDISKPNLWFLKPKRSWDPRDKKTYLSIYSFRCVQPLILETLYAVLHEPSRLAGIGSCLQSKVPIVVARALDFVAGGEWPWPLISYANKEGSQEYERRFSAARMSCTKVNGLLSSIRDVAIGGPPTQRPFALALFAEMAGKGSQPLLRHLLKDKNPTIQAVALCHLVALGDPVAVRSAEGICQRICDANLSGELVLAMERSGNLEYVPSMIAFLDRRGLGRDRSATHEVAFISRDALRRLTSFTFPLDARSAVSAWRSVQTIPNVQKRRMALRQILGEWANPLSVECTPMLDANDLPRMGRKALDTNGEDSPIFEFTVRNKSSNVITLPAEPDGIEWRTGGGGGSEGVGSNEKSNQDFVRLEPNGVLKFKLALDYTFIHPDQPATIEIEYSSDGHCYGLRAWMGKVNVSVIRGTPARSQEVNSTGPAGKPQAPAIQVPRRG